MQLTRLDIKGFKSFADKTHISFDEGITGIIGPNGCGKSNIIDSIRWVIGEQKISHLRSENQGCKLSQPPEIYQPGVRHLRISEIKILKLTLNEPISPDRFELAQPAGTELVRVGEEAAKTQP